MARFKVGQQVVCVRPGNGLWRGMDTLGLTIESSGPAYNDIVTVSDTPSLFPDAIGLVEYPDIPEGCTLPNVFACKWFEPLADITELKQILESQPEMI